MARDIPDKLRANARSLRKNLTDVERFVWYQLRSRRFQGFKFRRQFPIGRYVVDFVCQEVKLVLEFDGGQHAEQGEYDAERTDYLQNCGYQVLRFWNHDTLRDWDVVAEVIWEVLQERSITRPLQPPHP